MTSLEVELKNANTNVLKESTTSVSTGLHHLFLVGIYSAFDTGSVIICLWAQEGNVLVRSLGWLEDGGGLSVHKVIYTQCQVPVVPLGTWPGMSCEQFVFLPTPLHTGRLSMEQGCWLIFSIGKQNTCVTVWVMPVGTWSMGVSSIECGWAYTYLTLGSWECDVGASYA